MTNMKILIIEDEERSFMRLKRLLQQTDGTFEIEGPVTSVKDTAAILGDDKREYDIIFADIRLDDGDVFEAFLQVPVQVPVIFTTAYNEYALEAFKSNGIALICRSPSYRKNWPRLWTRTENWQQPTLPHRIIPPFWLRWV